MGRAARLSSGWDSGGRSCAPVTRSPAQIGWQRSLEGLGSGQRAGGWSGRREGGEASPQGTQNKRERVSVRFLMLVTSVLDSFLSWC